MRIRIFRAHTLAEAMTQIRRELGADALILSDRNRDGFVEVTAALEVNDPPDLHTPPQWSTGFDDIEPFTVPAAPQPLVFREPQAPHRPGLDVTMAWHGLPPRLAAALKVGPIETACARVFGFTPLPIGPEDAPLLLAGPPGSGKTLTVARLATRLVLAGKQPMVITADGKRAGAVEQLAAFTRLLGLTLVATNTPAMLARALERRVPGQSVLIDAPGLDLDDPEQAEALQALLSPSGAAMALVLPCGLDPTEAEEIAAAHAALGARALIATRTDPCRRLGAILCASVATGLALSEAGIGSAAADSLIPFTPGFLAERLQKRGALAASPSADLQPREAPRAKQSALPLHIAAQRRALSSS